MLVVVVVGVEAILVEEKRMPSCMFFTSPRDIHCDFLKRRVKRDLPLMLVIRSSFDELPEVVIVGQPS